MDYQNHFVLLNDEDLLALETGGLSAAARRLPDEELALRGSERAEPEVSADQVTDICWC